MFSIEELNDKNYKDLEKLQISPKQKEFVKDFKGCVEYKKRFPFLKIYGIKKDNIYIGCVAFARWDNDLSIKVEDRWTWFDEFFFDLKYQGKGYGSKVFPIIVNEIKKIYNPKFIVLSVRNDNKVAKKLYYKLGFKPSHFVYDYSTDSCYEKNIIGPKDEFVMFYNL